MKKIESQKENAPTLKSCPPRCRRIFNRFSAYLDREIPPGKCAEIRRHIRGCGNCGAFYNTFRKTVQLCRKSRPPVISRKNRKKALSQVMKEAVRS